MKIESDPLADALYIQLAEGDAETTEELKPGTMCDYDASGNMLGIEVLHVSKRTELPLKDETEEERKAAIHKALLNLQRSGAFSEIDDPVAWQREVRKDRPLPGRD